MNSLSETVCREDMCAGCMLCADICPSGAITIEQNIESYNARIDAHLCVNCGSCRKLCPQNEAPTFRRPIEWHQGWSREANIRANSSSGGLATEISRNFVRNGGEVCTCIFKDGRFVFGFFCDDAALREAAGSKYVKSDPHGIYKELIARLKQGKKMLMIALPCQIAAVLKLVGQSDTRNLYTIDLICHGTPAPEVLERFFAQKGLALKDIRGIQFRKKNQFNLYNEYTSVEKWIRDEYTHAFLKSMTYTKNCYHCQYAKLERVSDMTLGDSWGSELPDEEKQKGISLILCHTDKGKELLGMSNVVLESVDIERAVNTNGQLRSPSIRPERSDRFMQDIIAGKSFKTALFHTDPERAIKNMIKKYIVRKRPGGGYAITYLR